MGEVDRAIGYVRVSTPEQADEGFGLEAQIERILNIDDFEIDRIVRDEGETGTDLKREGLQKVLHMARNGKISYLVIFRLDRISRDMLDMFHVLRILRENDVEVVTTK